ncbi:hypothetical protein BGZ61DRAFT_467766, partial [Ilyonectria robusta]|uniref:uncharacterized protein n=1 Tax=Ilyonectria robusta TaxID=1079257 RepID=UPI001E8E3A60
STPQELQDDMISIVCVRCGEEKPAGDFIGKRKSVGHTKNCQDCRNQRSSHYSRSRGAILTLRNLAVAPSSTESPAPKRTEEDAGLLPPNDRFGTQPTSPERLRQCHTAKTLSGASISQPRIVLGTPIPPTQQSSRLFRTIAPSPPVTLTWLLDSSSVGETHRTIPPWLAQGPSGLLSSAAIVHDAVQARLCH